MGSKGRRKGGQKCPAKSEIHETEFNSPKKTEGGVRRGENSRETSMLDGEEALQEG